ncbi:hypothetical protein BDV95DRAFT_595756 [Massariosphaeria phaeospora]|uniref:RRM domain-containing protein n=1 Tax=Massariosphaeria phaeospora TaxID=100035 RepID=A0A7C8M6U4_9PLEO|nr:hypothetical protein BDV95DRAFT_595756 [Massariosphaeria phaeospora]
MPWVKIFVQNIPYLWTKHDVQNLYKHLQARKTAIPANMRGNAIVTFDSIADAETAMAATHKKKIDGRKLRVGFYDKNYAVKGRGPIVEDDEEGGLSDASTVLADQEDSDDEEGGVLVTSEDLDGYADFEGVNSDGKAIEAKTAGKAVEAKTIEAETIVAKTADVLKFSSDTTARIRARHVASCIFCERMAQRQA